MKKTVSIIMPAGRGIERTQPVINAWHDLNPEVEVDLVVSSPCVVYDKCQNIADDMTGNARAMALSYKYIKGKYLVWSSDRAYPTKSCLIKMIDFVDRFNPPFIGDFLLREKTEGYEINQMQVFGKQYSPWGMARIETFGFIGGFFDENYRSFWVDVDMSLRCWINGGEVKSCFDTELLLDQGGHDELHSSNLDKYFKKDWEYFVNKWGRVYEDAKLPDWNQFNYPIEKGKWSK